MWVKRGKAFGVCSKGVSILAYGNDEKGRLFIYNEENTIPGEFVYASIEKCQQKWVGDIC